jgi:hypothetical protein
MPPIVARAAGGASTVSQREVAALEKTVEAAGPALKRIYLLDNHELEVSSTGVERMRGMAVVLSPDAPLRGVDLLFSERGPGVIAAVRCDGVVENASALAERFSKLAQRVNVEAPSGARYDLVEHAAKSAAARTLADSWKDPRAWEAELGRHGHFLGLFREEIEVGLPTSFLVVHSDAGPAGRALLDYARAREGSLTARQLLGSREYALALSYAERNARRLLDEAALAFGVAVTTEEDGGAALATIRGARPELVVPDYVSRYNVLELSRGTDPERDDCGAEVVVYHSHATPLRQNTSGAVLTLADPRYGVLAYRGALGGAPAWSNQYASSFPIGAGRLRDEVEVARQRELLVVDVSQREYASRVVSWYGRRADQDAPVLNARLYRYFAIGDRQRRLREQFLGAPSAASTAAFSRLKPAYVLVPPPIACAK